jgi:hypothetical protein
MCIKCQDPSSVPPWSLGLPWILGVQNGQLGLHWGGCTYSWSWQFVHTHILCEEPDHSLSMLYGGYMIWLPNPGFWLYSCETLTLQFDRMGETRHSFVGPPRTHEWARMAARRRSGGNDRRMKRAAHEAVVEGGGNGGRERPVKSLFGPCGWPVGPHSFIFSRIIQTGSNLEIENGCFTVLQKFLIVSYS